MGKRTKRNAANWQQESKNAYNRMAETYENTPDGKFTNSFKDLLISAINLKDGNSVLDAACGTGTLLHELGTKANLSRAVGIDISNKMIEVAKKRFPQLEFLESACEPLPYKSDSFDVITVSASFHHFPEPLKFLEEARRVLKNNGNLVIAEVHFPIIIRQLANIFYLPCMKSGDVKIYSKKELVKMFKAAKFEVVESFRKGRIQIFKTVNKKICKD